MVSTLIELQAYRGNTKANGESFKTRTIVKSENTQKPSCVCHIDECPVHATPEKFERFEI